MLEPLPRVLLLQKPKHLLQHKELRFSIAPLFPGPAKVHGNGSRILLDSTPASGFTGMGWVDPVARWGRLIEAELHAYALPFVNTGEYSRSRPELHQSWSSASTLRSWLLALEEHSFDLFAVKRLASVCI